MRQLTPWLRTAVTIFTLVYLQACGPPAGMMLPAKQNVHKRHVKASAHRTAPGHCLSHILPLLQSDAKKQHAQEGNATLHNTDDSRDVALSVTPDSLERDGKVKRLLQRPQRYCSRFFRLVSVGVMLLASANYWIPAHHGLAATELQNSSLSNVRHKPPCHYREGSTHPIQVLHSNHSAMSLLTLPFTESLQKLLQSAYMGSNEQQCAAAQNKLRHVLAILPDSTLPIFEWIMGSLDSEAIEPAIHVNLLRTLRTVIGLAPSLAPKTLDKLSAITENAQIPQEVRSVAQQVLNIVKRDMPSAVTWSSGLRACSQS